MMNSKSRRVLQKGATKRRLLIYAPQVAKSLPLEWLGRLLSFQPVEAVFVRTDDCDQVPKGGDYASKLLIMLLALLEQQLHTLGKCFVPFGQPIQPLINIHSRILLAVPRQLSARLHHFLNPCP